MNKAGFTLIEILLSMVILSSVIFVGSLSFSVYSEKWQSGIGDFDAVYAESRNLILLQKMFVGASNYIIKNEKDDVAYFFEGTSERLVFVSNNPIYNPASPAVVSLHIETSSDGKQNLVYSEYSFEEQLLLHENQTLKKDFSIVLLSRENIRFNFFGWETKEQHVASYDGEDFHPDWQKTYDGDVSGMLPLAVSIIWLNSEPIIFTIPNDNAELLSYTKQKRNEA
jgi:prepilin-type N-terminal cleavage/methylation domain-containing protein